MSRIFITIGSAHSKAANVNPVDGICEVEEGMFSSSIAFERSEEGT